VSAILVTTGVIMVAMEICTDMDIRDQANTAIMVMAIIRDTRGDMAVETMMTGIGVIMVVVMEGALMVGEEMADIANTETMINYSI